MNTHLYTDFTSDSSEVPPHRVPQRSSHRQPDSMRGVSTAVTNLLHVTTTEQDEQCTPQMAVQQGPDHPMGRGYLQAKPEEPVLSLRLE